MLADVIDARHIWVRHLPCELHLLAEAEDCARRRGVPEGEHLEGDLLRERDVVGPIHGAHAAAAEALQDFIAVCEERSERDLRWLRSRLLNHPSHSSSARQKSCRISGPLRGRFARAELALFRWGFASYPAAASRPPVRAVFGG